MSELENNGVEIYKFPTDDETVAEINGQMNVSGNFIEILSSLCEFKLSHW